MEDVTVFTGIDTGILVALTVALPAIVTIYSILFNFFLISLSHFVHGKLIIIDYIFHYSKISTFSRQRMVNYGKF